MTKQNALATLILICAAACALPAPPAAAPTVEPAVAPVVPSPSPFQPLPPHLSPEEAAQTLIAQVPTAPAAAPVAAVPPDSAPSTGPARLWVDPNLPAGVHQALTLPSNIVLADSPENAHLRLVFGAHNPLSRWVYALAAPFPSVQDGASLETILNIWRGAAGSAGPGKPLLMDESALAGFSQLWGPPASGAVQTVPGDELLTTAWRSHPVWAIVPFEALEPRWKVLAVDGQSPLSKSFDPASYPLTLPISLTGDLQAAQNPIAALIPASNRDPAQMTVLAMTGVTALVRATAFAMEQKGVLYPAQDIGDWLREADLTHISNEVPFAEDCPYPDPLQAGMRFCSDPRYIKLLESVGADIIELTGDHFQDWGTSAMRLTLDMYQARGWPYYGGGANLDEARQAVVFNHNGNPLAFIGCNAKGGSFAQAGPNRSGAAACDLAWIEKEVQRLRAAGYLPIATFQHFEYYTYRAQPDQKRDFKRLAGAGAVIVSGSQAHQPQALEFADGALIHYGLGNLFFDQYDVSLATRQGFIDRHIFYAGRHIGTELLTIIFVDYARPRPMTAVERQDLLQTIFAASGW